MSEQDKFNAACFAGRFDLVVKMCFPPKIRTRTRKTTQVDGVFDWNQGLYWASVADDVRLITLLIEKGANNWNVGLIQASINGNVELVEFFIGCGADQLNEALCQTSSPAVADLLIRKGATTIDLAMANAAKFGKTQLVEFLLDRVRWTGTIDRAFFEACQAGHYEVVALLIQKRKFDFEGAIQVTTDKKTVDVLMKASTEMLE